MPLSYRDTKAYREDEKAQHAILTDEEKRRIIQVRDRPWGPPKRAL
jgi:hypothetical protein